MIIYLGIPMYGGAHGLTVSSLLSVQKHLMEKGHTVIYDIVAGGSILPKVRNGIVKRFMDSASDVLVFIDADMVFEPETVEKLIHAPFDVSVANYRNRHSTVKYMADAVMSEGQLVGTYHKGDIWLQTHRAGTGLMAIPRHTVESMISAYPELAYEDGHALFDFELSEGQYHGEDYTFCKRLEAICGQIFILADCYIGHVGTAVYGGNYHEYLRGSHGIPKSDV